jgi:S-adenosylmethionine decarboxylase
VSKVVPNQFDICIVNPTMNDEEFEKQKNEQYQVPNPEHINCIQDFQDMWFRGETHDLPVDSDDEAQTQQMTPNEWDTTSNGKDYFIKKAGFKFAGNHLLIDLWGATNLDKADIIEAALRESAIVSGATILHCHLHNFDPNGGISGVLVLAESHISVHSWPERGYAAFDVFMCGDAQPLKSIPILKKAFKPGFVNVVEARRGLETAD